VAHLLNSGDKQREVGLEDGYHLCLKIVENIISASKLLRIAKKIVYDSGIKYSTTRWFILTKYLDLFGSLTASCWKSQTHPNLKVYAEGDD
jgi:hypothetical protein